tara:strand:+ start:53 stop:301 length:249 start_codon:yes stop_codon:yes gene_type:complete
MECVLLWLDDLDDLVFSLRMLAERMRRIVIALLTVTGALAVAGLSAAFAISSPPLALALVCLLTVTYLYRGTVGPQPNLARH